MIKHLLLKTMLLLCALIVGSGSMWASYSNVTTFSSASVVSGSGYTTYSDNDWYLSIGGNNVSVGFNKTESNAKKIDDALGTSANADYYGAVIKSKKKLDNISQITFTYDGGSGTTGKIYLAYSSDGSTWNALTLTSGSQGSSATTNMTFQFDEIESAYYGIILEKGSSTGVFRWDNVTATFDKLDAPKYALTFSNPVGGTISVTKGDSDISTGEEFEEGTELTIVATPATGYDFSSWTAEGATFGDATASTTTLTMPAAAVTLSASFTAQSIVSDILLDDVTNGTISSNKSTANVGETVEITAAPASGYVTGEWTVIDDENNDVTVTKTGDNTATFTMPATDVLVSVTFIEKHTVTYYVAGVSNTTERVHGSALSLDNPASVGGMTFAGWSSSKDTENPVFIANTTAVNTDITVYAIFVAVPGSNSYQLVEADQTDWSGDYLIAYNSTTFADGRIGGTEGLGKQYQKVSPGNKLSGKEVDTTWGDTYNVTLEAIDDSDPNNGYVLKTKDGKYNYQTKNDNGLASTENKSTAANYPISVTFTSSSDVKLCLGGNAAGAVFRYNTQGYFRFYKNGGQSAVYLYKKITSAPIYSLGTAEVAIGASGYASFCYDRALDFSTTEVKAYKGKVNGDKVTLTEITDGIVPANTGVVLVGDEDSYEVPVTTTAATADFSDNEMVGVLTRTQVLWNVGDKYNYILQSGEFNKANDGYLKAYRAYLSTTYNVEAAGARSLKIVFGDESTGMNAIENESSVLDNSFYDLQGRRVENPKKGLYIVNGKKALVK